MYFPVVTRQFNLKNKYWTNVFYTGFERHAINAEPLFRRYAFEK